jgi:TonB family protein
MARLRIQSSAGWLAACLGLAACAVAQSDPTVQPRVIDARQATRLLVNQSKPDYPAVAHDNYIQGQVQVEVMVGADGHVHRAHVLHGHPLLAASALKSVRSWVYRPFVTPAGPAPFSTMVKVAFDLNQREHTEFPTTPERDLEQRIKLPEVVEQPADPPGSSPVRLRVLVGEDGRVIDSTLVSGSVALLAAAQTNLTQWKFQPARWGNMTIPWYLEVTVPAESSVRPEALAQPKQH